jgi:hypothetical protein
MRDASLRTLGVWAAVQLAKLCTCEPAWQLEIAFPVLNMEKNREPDGVTTYWSYTVPVAM